MQFDRRSALPLRNALRAWTRDPRAAQITVLSLLVGAGLVFLDFDIRIERALGIVAAALATQALGNAGRGERCDPRSALISALSLTLLLRADHVGWCIAAAALAIASKFLLRAQGRHVFNPTNFAIVALLGANALLGGHAVWVSSGQWGSAPIVAAALAAGAFWILPRVHGDVTIAFVTFWAAALFARAQWLGDPFSIPLHQLESGSLVLFAAFMLSDPRTIPNARSGRIAFAALVAAGGYLGRFVFFEPNALLYALALASLFVPLLDRCFHGPTFLWPTRPKETLHGAPHPITA